jgi:hypothetical protein
MHRMSNLRLRARVSVVLLSLVAGLVVAGAVLAVTVSEVQTAAEAALKKKLRPDSLSVKVEPFESGNWTEQGRFKSLVGEAENASVDGLVIESIRVKLFDVTLDLDDLLNWHRIKILSVENNRFSAKVSEDAINKFLATKNKDMKVKDLKVDFKGSKVEATGKYNLAGLGNQIKVLGYFEVKQGRLLNFFVEKAWVNGIPLPAGQVRNFMGKLNPVLDLDKVTFQPNLRNVAIDEDKYMLLSS